MSAVRVVTSTIRELLACGSAVPIRVIAIPDGLHLSPSCLRELPSADFLTLRSDFASPSGVRAMLSGVRALLRFD